MPSEVCLRLPANASATAATRCFVEAVLDRWEMPGAVMDAQIIATELVENVLRHTSGGGELRLRHRPGMVLIEVADDSDTLPKVVESEDYTRANGRGLRMVRVISRDWGVRLKSPGKVVWAELEVCSWSGDGPG